jgi:hypothetical protein
LRNYAQSPAPAIRPPDSADPPVLDTIAEARLLNPDSVPDHTLGNAMGKRIALILLGIAILAIAGGGVLLASWHIPAPTKQLEKVIPNDRFGR